MTLSWNIVFFLKDTSPHSVNHKIHTDIRAQQETYNRKLSLFCWARISLWIMWSTLWWHVPLEAKFTLPFVSCHHCPHIPPLHEDEIDVQNIEIWVIINRGTSKNVANLVDTREAYRHQNWYTKCLVPKGTNGFWGAAYSPYSLPCSTMQHSILFSNRSVEEATTTIILSFSQYSSSPPWPQSLIWLLDRPDIVVFHKSI